MHLTHMSFKIIGSLEIEFPIKQSYEYEEKRQQQEKRMRMRYLKLVIANTSKANRTMRFSTTLK